MNDIDMLRERLNDLRLTTEMMLKSIESLRIMPVDYMLNNKLSDLGSSIEKVQIAIEEVQWYINI